MSWMAAALPFVGPTMASGANYFAQRDTNNTNLDISRANNALTLEMSNTAYQRAVGDMRAAGLNPMLAYSQGGAGTPSLNTPTVQNELGSIVSSAQEFRRMNAEIANLKETNELTKAAKFKALADAELSRTNAKNVKQNTDINELSIPGLKNKSDIDKSKFGKFLSWIDRGAETIGKATSAAKPTGIFKQNPYYQYQQYQH